MSQSDFNQVTFFQEHYLGDPPPFFSGMESVVDSPSNIQIPGNPDFIGYPYVIDISANPPHPDRVLTRITLETTSGTDSSGVIFGGNFRPNINNINIVGNLDTVEELVVRNALSVNEGNINNGQIIDEYIINTLGLVSAGVSDFGIIIPYVEQDISVPGDTIEIPFFRMSSTGLSRDTHIIVTENEPRQIIIDDGIQSAIENAMVIENIALPGDRDFNTLDVSVNSINFIINYSEITDNKLIFKIQERTSDILYPISYTSTLNGANSVIELGLDFDIVFNYDAIYDRIFKIRPYARRPSRPLNTDDLIRPNYARLELGIGVGLDFSINGSEVTYSITTHSLESGRSTPDALTFTNGFHKPIEFEIDTGLNRIRIRGENSAGSDVAQVFPFSNYITIEDISQAVNDWISTINGWENIVSLNVNEPYIQNSIFTEYLNEVPTVFVSNSLNLSITLPLILISNTDYTWTMDISNRSLRNVLDIKSRYEEEYGSQIGLPISLPDYGGMPDSWIDHPGFALVVDSRSVSPGNGAYRAFFFRGYGYEDESLNPLRHLYYYSNNSAKYFNDFEDIQDACDWINSQVPHIVATPGLYYGELDVEAIRPLGRGWRRKGNTSLGNLPENSSINANKIQIIGAQENIGIHTGFGPIENSFPSIDYENNFSIIIAESTETVSQLATTITNKYVGVLEANPLNDNDLVEISNLSEISPTSIIFSGDTAVLSAEFEQPIIEVYELNNYSTIESLVSSINSDWLSRGFNTEIETGTQDRPDAVPSNLVAFDNITDLSEMSQVFTGEVSAIDPPEPPKKFIYLEYNLNWIGDTGTNIDEQGIQVALGGYRDKNGQFFINQSPNSFFEPGYNSIFNVVFNASEASEIYILIRTRQDTEGSFYTSLPSDYQGLTRFSNGYPSQVTNGTLLSGSPFDVWEDSEWNDGNVPSVLVVHAESNVMNLFVDDISVLDSIQVQINNFPTELDEFSFLALNRTNLNASMAESRQGRSFGLVLDNRGIWDILIGPEAEIRRVSDGEFDYLNFSFDHSPIDSDEAYNYEISNLDNLETSVVSSIDIIPVPGFPKVAVLRIESGVKRYLSAQRNASGPNSFDACSLDINILAEGRESGIQGTATVTVFEDYTCVYDIGLCDFFWNLTDPPSPQLPDTIDNTVSISYTGYIDCQKLDIDSDGDNARFSFPLLITAKDVPVFENGNALLLIKGEYSASVESYFFPSSSSFATIQNSECVNLSDNEPLTDSLNRELIFVEGESEPITDSVRISQIINGSDPYMYIKPRFQFPNLDQGFECGPNEIVIASISYQFRDWDPGFREDNILIGVDTIISNSTFSAPELNFCYKYYYRREI